MIFWASAETDQLAGTALEKTRKSVEPYLNATFASSNLATLDCELRYVPIVMIDDSKGWYPARSKLRKKQKLYDCAPVLDAKIFVNGSFEDQLREYLRGVALSTPYLAALGATQEQVETFKEILDGAVERILVEQPAETRH